MESTNSDKSNHGNSAKGSLDNILKRCIELGYIRNFTKTYTVGKEGYGNKKQFYAPFLITFEDETQWALFSTTSMRTDRIKGQQWDASNLKEINKNITKAYLIYPDSVIEKEKKSFLEQDKKYRNHYDYSFLDGIISQDNISNLIEEYALKNKNSGQIKDIQGNSFESKIADILNFPKNLEKWKSSSNLIEGMHYDIFKTIIEYFRIEKESTNEIKATSNKQIIGKLPSGGNPKTDVLVTITLNNQEKKHFTISCKRSSNKNVSVHQYNADTFADVLDKNNTKLRKLLNEFQKCGNLRDFGEINQKKLTDILKPFKEKLSLWVLGGKGGDCISEKQIADYILTYVNNDSCISIKSIEEYYRNLVKENVNGHFGTPFSWTYPSKRKGKDIQLKCKLIK